MGFTWGVRLSWLLCGLTLYGVGLAAQVRASIGLAPWSVLSQGVSLTTGLTFGMATNAIGLLLLTLWIPLRQRPGVGTVLNVVVIGVVSDIAMGWIPTPHALAARVGLFLLGMVAVGVATGIYIAPGLGTGARDGLMVGVQRRTGLPVVAVRTAIELTVLVIGWLLGGRIGLGTVLEAMLIGSVVHRTMPFFAARYASSQLSPSTAGSA
ncbi:MAG: YczE/YyaS/YitT family protein [Nocardioides sp.]